MRTEKVFIIPDTHIPFHDLNAWELVLKVIKLWGPRHVIMLGDWLDLYSLSRHLKDPALRSWDFQTELDAAKIELDRLQVAAPRADITWLAGNHCERLETAIAKDAPTLGGMLSVPKEMELKRRGIRWVPYQELFTLGKVNYVHDTGSAGGKAHEQSETIVSDNIVIGHTHRMAVSYLGNMRHQSHVAAMFGWLGDKRYAKYMASTVKNRYWTLGFGTGHMTPAGVTYLQAHPIINYTACVDGKVYGL